MQDEPFVFLREYYILNVYLLKVNFVEFFIEYTGILMTSDRLKATNTKDFMRSLMFNVNFTIDQRNRLTTKYCFRKVAFEMDF